MTKEMKTCSKCGETKGLSGFYKNKRGKFGVKSVCKDCVTEYAKNYFQENRERILGYKKNYRQENMALQNSYAAKRRSRKLEATPPWLTEEQNQSIKLYYETAKSLEKKDGIKRHVDHIIPLKGENICGLHVPWNLQVLTAEENLRKSNSYSEPSS